MKLLLVSHGSIAKGYAETLVDFFGAKNIYYGSVTLENGNKELKKMVEEKIKEWKNEKILICSDLKSGSPNQTVLPYLNKENIFLVTGMNLMLLLQIVMEKDISLKKLELIIKNSKEDLAQININQGFDLYDDE